MQGPKPSYRVVRVHGDGLFQIVCDRDPVRTPMGKPYITTHQELAEELCHDFEQYGDDPQTRTCLMRLHACYLEYGGIVPRRILEEDLLVQYDPALDVALARPATEGAAPTTVVAWFGPVEPRTAMRDWLRSRSVRQLIALLVCTATFSSVLVGYRLLRGEISPQTLAAGLRKYGYSGSWAVTDPMAALRTIKSYAQLPDEPELLAH